MLNTLTYFLFVWVEVIVLLLAGHSLVRICVRVVRALVGEEPGITLVQSTSFGFAAVIFLVSVPIFAFRFGLQGLNLYVDAIAALILVLVAFGVYEVLRKRESKPIVESIRSLPWTYLAVLLSLVLVVSYLYSVQSSGTSFDFFSRNYKVIEWGLHDGTLANSLLQSFYSYAAYPAYWLYPVADLLVPVGSAYFSLSIVALLGISLLVYSFAREAWGKEVGLSAALLAFATPLTILYSYRELNLDMATYYAIFASFYGVWRLLRSEERSSQLLWALLAGIATSAALFTDRKGFVLLLILPSLIAYQSRSRLLKVSWASAFFVGISYYVSASLIRGGGLTELDGFALLVPIALMSFVLYTLISWRELTGTAAKSKAGGIGLPAYATLALASLPGVLWHLVAGYFSLLLQGARTFVIGIQGTLLSILLPTQGTYALTSLTVNPPVIVAISGYTMNFVRNYPNVLSSVLGLISFPFYGVPFALLGFAALAYLLVKKKDQGVNSLFIFAVATAPFVYIFSNISGSIETWRYFLIFLPLNAIVVAYGLSRLITPSRLLYLTSAFSALYVFTSMHDSLSLTGTAVWFANTVNLISAWFTSGGYSWTVSAILIVVLYLASRWSSFDQGIEWFLHGLTGRWNKVRRPLELFVAIFLVLVLAAPFSSLIGSTSLASVTSVKENESLTWNAGLLQPFQYIASNREEFGNAVFLTIFGYGIELYAGVPSIELTDPYMTAHLTGFKEDFSLFPETLQRYDIRYALVPTPSNMAPTFTGDTIGYGGRAQGYISSTALKDLLGNSTIIKEWSGWILYNLTWSYSG